MRRFVVFFRLLQHFQNQIFGRKLDTMRRYDHFYQVHGPLDGPLDGSPMILIDHVFSCVVHRSNL